MAQPTVVEHVERAAWPWEALLEIEPHARSKTIDTSGLAKQIDGPPTHVEGVLWDLDVGDHSILPFPPLDCNHQVFVRPCATWTEDRTGEATHRWRADVVDGRTIRNARVDDEGLVDLLHTCRYDALGRVTEHHYLTRGSVSSCRWDEVVSRQAFDARGAVTFSEESGLETSSWVVRYEYDERDQPTQILEYGGSPGEGYFLSLVHRLEWSDDRLLQHQIYHQRTGDWFRGAQLFWDGDYVRVVDSDVPVSSIDQAIGDGQYRRILWSGNRYEYERRGDIETVTVSTYPENMLRYREHLQIIGNERRKLIEEQLVPEEQGMQVVERWHWEADRVVVEYRHERTGRDIYMLDCTGMPTIEDLLDPQCMPPVH